MRRYGKIHIDETRDNQGNTTSFNTQWEGLPEVTIRTELLEAADPRFIYWETFDAENHSGVLVCGSFRLRYTGYDRYTDCWHFERIDGNDSDYAKAARKWLRELKRRAVSAGMHDNPYAIINGEWAVKAEYGLDGNVLCYDIGIWQGGKFVGLPAELIDNLNYNIVAITQGVLSGLESDFAVMIHSYYPPPHDLYLAERIELE